ncbi:helix-turn-helix transcriptional regulator [Streptomyces sp. NPDC050560]|uniref:helix-turn-helix transcriptional regulator n=1 Tax=Streptomyces sp. NPDC050560 TaxID=3365630 RepID=UPI00378F8B37
MDDRPDTRPGPRGGHRGSALGAFLRARRGALDPRGAGLPDDGRPRRVPGLRREELAQLAHVSTDYVVRLEQGRAHRVSPPVLNALADALRLAPDERTYLFTVADVPQLAPAGRPAPQRVDSRLRLLLDGMHDIPALVLGRRTDVLAWNRAAVALLTDFAAVPPGRRNLYRMTFLDDTYRSLYADWPHAARDCVAMLRMEAGRHPDDPELAALIDELRRADRDFATWWESHRVSGPRQLTKTYLHPVAGPLTLDVQQLTVDTSPDQLLVAYTAPPDTPSWEALHFLLRWSPSSTS